MSTRSLINLLSQPTAPYRELHVHEYLKKELEKAGVPHFDDPSRNLIVGVSNEGAYRKLVSQRTKEPVFVFISHMDHPGFHAQSWVGRNKLEIKWFGGSPTKHLTGAKVWLADSSGWRGHGTMTRATLIPSKRGIESGVVRVEEFSKQETPDPTDLFGGFGFRKPAWQSGKLIYTKAADDLVGVHAIVALAKQRMKNNSKSGPGFIGLLTRAEEVGFIGAIAHYELGWLKQAHRPVIGVSLETSRTLPGAVFGKGPVVRLGDRATLFDPGSTHQFLKIAKQTLKEKYQSRIMDGGTCEGTVSMAFGFKTIAVSIPLGNYHNQSFEGGPDSRGPLGPAPEYVHLDDVAGMQKLLSQLMKPGVNWELPWADVRAGLIKRRREAQPLLRLR